MKKNEFAKQVLFRNFLLMRSGSTDPNQKPGLILSLSLIPVCHLFDTNCLVPINSSTVFVCICVCFWCREFNSDRK